MQTEAVQPSFFNALSAKWNPNSTAFACWINSIVFIQMSRSSMIPSDMLISYLLCSIFGNAWLSGIPGQLSHHDIWMKGIHLTGKCCAVRIHFADRALKNCVLVLLFQFVWGCSVSFEFGQIWALEVLYNNVLHLIWSLSTATHISAVHLQLDADLESTHAYAVAM